MGAKYQYNCSKCDYSVMCCGEEDCGFIAVVNTYTCHDCNEIVDIEIGSKNNIINLEHIEDLIKRYKAIDTINYKDSIICPECHGKNITIWSESNYACPKCNSKMEVDYENIMMWD